MYIPAVDSLETARLAHSFCEDWSLNFFWALVGCELAELYFEHNHRWRWSRLAKWTQYGPEYRTLFSFESFFKASSWATFFLAISLEFGAAHFSGTVDRLSDEAITYEQRQNRAALVVAGNANREAAQLRAAIADRDLSHKEQDDIRAPMKSFAGHEVFIRSYPNDPESARLVVMLKSALEPTVHVADRTGEMGATWLSTGLILGIRVEVGHNDRTFSEALVRSLRSNGHLLIDDLSPFADGDGPTEILIGVKPVALAKQVQDATATAREQGPRAKLLAEAAPRLTKELAPFAGQRVGLYVCGQPGVTEQETLDTWGAIANILDSDTVDGVTGAKWKQVPTNLNWAANCGAAKGLGQGVTVFVSKRASKGTTEAATILARGLARALPPSPNRMLSIQDPDFTKLTVNRGIQSKDSPWAMAALDLTTVLIGQHP